MLPLNGFVKCRANIYVQWGDIYISDIEHNRKIKLSVYTHLTHINTISEYCHASVIIYLHVNVFI